MRDLIVVGAGPAGLATALNAAQAGLSTVVVDAREGPIDKACGEGLMPGALSALQRLGVPVPGRDFRGIRYLDGDHVAEARFSTGHGRGVRRTELQRALCERAEALGVEVVHARVGEIHQDAHSVSAAGLQARWLVAADGLHSPVRRTLGLDRPVTSAPPRWGLRQHFSIAPWSDLVEVHWSPSSEAYVTPVSETTVGVAVLSERRASWADQLACFPSLRDRLPDEVVSTVRGAGPLRQRSARRVAGRVLLVGDAAGYVDALTGEGISVALKEADVLVTCLLAGDAQRYEREWLRVSRAYRHLTGTLLWTRRRRLLRPAIVPLAARVPFAFRAVVDALAR